MNGLTKALQYFLLMKSDPRVWVDMDASQPDVIRIDVGNINFNTGAHERRVLTRTYFRDGSFTEQAHA